MIRNVRIGLAVAVLTVAGLATDAGAGIVSMRNAIVTTAAEGQVVQVTHRSRKPQVRGFVRRGGYYSYRPEDSINTYGDSRTKYGSTNVYRDPNVDQQTRFGPFDHGFFYDSGLTTPYGGNSPYIH